MRLFKKVRMPAELVEAGQAWQRKHALKELDPNAEVLFCIPLKAKAVSNDWATVNRNLRNTIQCLIDQTDGRWRALICCQDAPEGLPDDPRIEHLPYPVPFNPKRNDKRDKLPFMYEHASKRRGWDGYLFVLDADDIIHPELVKYFLTDRHPAGYIMPLGYMYDVAADCLGYMQPKSLFRFAARPFWKNCGSCSAIRFDLRDGLGFLELIKSRGRHTEQKERLAAFGVHLKEVEFPAGVCVVNHGDNDRLRKGNLDFTVDYIRRNGVRAEAAPAVRDLFKLQRLRVSH
jgi:hypothetical protein